MTDDLRTPPNDVEAEKAVLGSMLLAPFAIEEGLQLGDADFYQPAHRLIFEGIAEMFTEGKPVDLVTVNAELQARGWVQRTGGGLYLHELTQVVASPGSVTHFVDIVRDRAVLRAVLTSAQRAQQWAYEPQGDDANNIADRAASAMAAVRDRGLTDDAGDTTTIDDLLGMKIAYNWLVPGLFERADRLIITGHEGSGKTTLLRMITVALAAGLHPFTLEPTEPSKVLVVDCENSQAMSQRKLRPIVEAAARRGRPVHRDNLRFAFRPDGLDLAGHTDTRWLLKRVEKIKPDVLVIGPLYRLHVGDPNDERSARQIASVLDRARSICGSVVLAETHSPHGNTSFGQRTVRPFGSSLWLRWPEFGYGIRHVEDEKNRELRMMDVIPWRGPRDEREWPTQIIAGGSSGWPWKVYNGFSSLREAA